MLSGVINTKEINYKLYLVTDDYYLNSRDSFTVIEECLKAGVTMLQYRAKTKSSREMLKEAEQLKELTLKYQIPLIINDRLDIALAVEAEGVHLGQNDLPLTVAQKYMPNKIIGVSATSLEEGREAILQGADYVGVGPVFPTTTKKDAKPALGLKVIQDLKSEFPTAKLVAIGGISLDNAKDVINTGVNGLAIISAILGCSNPGEAVRSFLEL